MYSRTDALASSSTSAVPSWAAQVHCLVDSSNLEFGVAGVWRNLQVRSLLLRAVAALVAIGAALAASDPYAKFPRAPDVINARYGPHPRHVLDLWHPSGEQPAPVLIFIHGGGFRTGDKTSVPPQLVELCLKAGIAVASINYRLSDEVHFPAFMLDGARAVQYTRLWAGRWRLDPQRIALCGVSAGAGISLWVAYHDDLADPASSDPVARRSTRVVAVAGLGAQTTYDPRAIAKFIGEAAARHPALEPFYGLYGHELQTPRAFRLFEEASPITYLTTDDPPTFLYYNEPDEPLPPDAKPGYGIHHPRFGRLLLERAQPLGVQVIVRHEQDYGENPLPKMLGELVEFFRKQFENVR